MFVPLTVSPAVKNVAVVAPALILGLLALSSKPGTHAQGRVVYGLLAALAAVNAVHYFQETS